MNAEASVATKLDESSSVKSTRSILGNTFAPPGPLELHVAASQKAEPDGRYIQLFTLPMITDEKTAQVTLQTLYRRNQEWSHLESTNFKWLWKRAYAMRQKTNRLQRRAAGKSEEASAPALLALSVKDLVSASITIHDEYQALHRFVARWAEEEKVVDRIHSNKAYQKEIFRDATNDFVDTLTETTAGMAAKNLMRKKREQVISELIKTEETYIAGLKRLQSKYAQPLKGRIDKIDWDLMFAEISTLLSAHEPFLFKLKSSNSVVQEVLHFAYYFKLYTVYSASFSRVPTILNRIKKNNARVRKKIQEEDNNCSPATKKKKGNRAPKANGYFDMRLHSLLQLPIMRLPRYKLLLKELGKWTPPRTLQFELDMCNKPSRESVRFVQSSTGDWVVDKLFGDSETGCKGQADLAGFRCGDIVVAIDDQPVAGQLSGDQPITQTSMSKFTIKRHDVRAAVMKIHNCTMHVDKCIGESRVSAERTAIYQQLPLNPRRHEVYEQVLDCASVAVEVARPGAKQRPSSKVSVRYQHRPAPYNPKDADPEGNWFDHPPKMTAELEAAWKSTPKGKVRVGMWMVNMATMTQVHGAGGASLHQVRRVTGSAVSDAETTAPGLNWEPYIEGVPLTSQARGYISAGAGAGDKIGLDPLDAEYNDSAHGQHCKTTARSVDLLVVFNDCIVCYDRQEEQATNAVRAVLSIPIEDVQYSADSPEQLTIQTCPVEQKSKDTALYRFGASPGWMSQQRESAHHQWSWFDSELQQGSRYSPAICAAIEAAFVSGQDQYQLRENAYIDFLSGKEIEKDTEGKPLRTFDVWRNSQTVNQYMRDAAIAESKAAVLDKSNNLKVRVTLSMSKSQIDELKAALDDVCESALLVRGMPFSTIRNFLTEVPPTIDELRSLWEARANETNSKLRNAFFSSILDIYTYAYLGRLDSGHVMFLRNIYSNIGQFRKLQKSAFVLTSQDTDPGLLIESLAMRVPVYFGHPVLQQFGFRQSWFKVDETQMALGYNPLRSQQSADIERARYVIAGRVSLHPTSRWTNICVVHAWGCNFESRDSYDYKYIHCATVGDDDEFERRFKAATFKMFRMCCEAAIHLGCHTLRVPAVGQGRYCKELPRARRQMLDRLFLDCFIMTTDTYTSLKISRRFPYHVEQPETNLFQGITEDNTCLLNAWDSRSFIGNGGSQDMTIDGRMVCGSLENPESCGNNTSFLHNVFFMPELLNTERWKFLDDSLVKQTTGAPKKRSRNQSIAWFRYVVIWCSKEDQFEHAFFESAKEGEAKYQSVLKEKPNLAAVALYNLSIATERHIRMKFTNAKNMWRRLWFDKLPAKCDRYVLKIAKESIMKSSEASSASAPAGLASTLPPASGAAATPSASSAAVLSSPSSASAPGPSTSPVPATALQQPLTGSPRRQLPPQLPAYPPPSASNSTTASPALASSSFRPVSPSNSTSFATPEGGSVSVVRMEQLLLRFAASKRQAASAGNATKIAEAEAVYQRHCESVRNLAALLRQGRCADVGGKLAKEVTAWDKLNERKKAAATAMNFKLAKGLKTALDELEASVLKLCTEYQQFMQAHMKVPDMPE